MMMLRHSLTAAAWIGAVFAVGACSPPEPKPSQNTDLGTDGKILLPTQSAWHDKKVASGQAEWKPFRKPVDAAAAEAATGGDAGGEGSAAAEGGVESEIRDLVDEFNELVKEGKVTEALDFLTDDQAPIGEKAIQLLPALEKKLTEVAEAAPGTSESIGRLSREFSLTKVFGFAVKDLKANGADEVVGSLVNPDAADTATSAQVRFTRDSEGDWFIESPRIAVLNQVFPTIQTAMDGLDSILAAVKSGTAPGADLDAKVAELNGVLAKLADPGGTSAPNAEKSTEAAPEEPKPESAPEEPPPKPEKPVTGG